MADGTDKADGADSMLTAGLQLRQPCQCRQLFWPFGDDIVFVTKDTFTRGVFAVCSGACDYTIFVTPHNYALIYTTRLRAMPLRPKTE